MLLLAGVRAWAARRSPTTSPTGVFICYARPQDLHARGQLCLCVLRDDLVAAGLEVKAIDLDPLTSDDAVVVVCSPDAQAQASQGQLDGVMAPLLRQA
jgi:hypothetical protein